MKILPKFQQGGQFNSFFTTYTPIQIQAPSQSQQGPTRSRQSYNDEEKGKLSEKDFFTMLKDIDGLPNEMNAIVNNLMDIFRMSNLTGVDPESLATTYLQNLYQIKIAAQNKKKYDDALSVASKNGSLAEPAISMDGRIVVQNNEGQIDTINLSTYLSNDGNYYPLTVSNLARIRAYNPQLANNQFIFDIITNSMGFEAFQELVDKAKQTLGNTEITRNGYFTNEGQASKGLELLNTLKQDDKIQALGSVTAQGLYEYKIIDKTQLQQLNALTNYIATVFPDRAKTWAAIKMNKTDKNQATRDLILQYLLAGSTQNHSFDIQYKGTVNKVQEGSSSSTNSQEDPKKGFWSQIISDQGGDDFTFTILSKNGRMSVQGKFHGTTPGLNENKSLGDYIASSGIGYILKNNKNITFGDAKISTNSFNDVMVNAYTGAARVSLPIKVDGTVDLEIAKRWVNVLDKLQESGFSPGSVEYNQKKQELIKDNQLESLIGQDGIPNKNRFGLFLVLEGYTSEKAKAIQNNKQISFKDVQSEFIIPAGDDNQLYDMIINGLSNKDRGKYDLSNGLFGDDLFKGNIYIPLNNNLVSAQNADNNDIKQSTSYIYEKAYQQKSTNSNEL